MSTALVETELLAAYALLVALDAEEEAQKRPRRGGPVQVVTDHGSLTGLGDDDHTQYVPVDGVARQLADAGYPNALLLDGSRDMTDDLQVIKDSFRAILGAHTADPVVGVAHSYVKLYEPTTDTMLWIGHYADFPFDVWVKKGAEALRNPMYYDYLFNRIEIDNLHVVTARVENAIVDLCSNLTFADDSTCRLPLMNSGLPTPSSAYRGHFQITKGNGAFPDEAFICLWNGAEYKWFKINMTEVP